MTFTMVSGRREGHHLHVVPAGPSPPPHEVPVRPHLGQLRQVQRQVRRQLQLKLLQSKLFHQMY